MLLNVFLNAETNQKVSMEKLTYRTNPIVVVTALNHGKSFPIHKGPTAPILKMCDRYVGGAS